MNALGFYEQFKAMLRHTGIELKFGQMEQVEVVRCELVLHHATDKLTVTVGFNHNAIDLDELIARWETRMQYVSPAQALGVRSCINDMKAKLEGK